MAFTSQIRDWWYDRRCNYGSVLADGFFGRSPVRGQPEVHDLYRAIEAALLNTDYEVHSDGYIGSRRFCPSGIGGKTCQASGKDCSLHNYVLALDIEYNYNRHIRARIYREDFAEDWFPSICVFSLENIDGVEGIKNVQGEQMVRWLGWSIGDTMHFQVNVPPERTTVDWDTVPEEEMREPDNWAKPSWEWALNEGLMTEHSDPHATMTKQETAVIAKRYFDKIDKTGDPVARAAAAAAQARADTAHIRMDTATVELDI